MKVTATVNYRAFPHAGLPGPMKVEGIQGETVEHILETLITMLHLRQIEVVEALSVSGIAGMLSGLDENGEAIILRYPDELKKAHEAGRDLVVGK